MQRLTVPYFSILAVALCAALLFFPACANSTRQSERAAALAAREEETRVAGHNWDSITYPELPVAPPGIHKPALNIRRLDDGLLLHLEYWVSLPEDGREKGLPTKNQIAARLHAASGKITESIPDEQNGTPGLAYMGDMIYPFSFRFPWGPNVMEEGWIELRLSGQVYWIELPYGFTRNPADQLTPSKEMQGPPSVAPAMKETNNGAMLVPWLTVYYHYGVIQNGWRLSLSLSNTFDSTADISLQRDDFEIGKSAYLWDLHSPRTSISIKQPGTWNVKGGATSVRLLEGGTTRTDMFNFNRNSADENREWGTAVVTVDEKSYELIVPSSLYKYCHGNVDPRDLKNLGHVPRPEERE